MHMANEFEHLGIRDVSVRGGSLSITVPPAVTDKLKIQEGDKVVFLYDPNHKVVIFEKMQEARTASGLSFSFSTKEPSKR